MLDFFIGQFSNNSQVIHFFHFLPFHLHKILEIKFHLMREILLQITSLGQLTDNEFTSIYRNILS